MNAEECGHDGGHPTEKKEALACRTSWDGEEWSRLAV